MGTDLDGGFGKSQSPSDVDSISDVSQIENILTDRGYKEEDINRIFNGNWLRKLRSGLRNKDTSS